MWASTWKVIKSIFNSILKVTDIIDQTKIITIHLTNWKILACVYMSKYGNKNKF